MNRSKIAHSVHAHVGAGGKKNDDPRKTSRVIIKDYRRLFIGVLILFALFNASACKQDKMVELTVMSYNIRHGVGLDTLLDLSRAAEVVQAQSPDLVGLQEIDQFCTRTDSVDQTDFLAENTSMTGTFGKFMDYDGGRYGMATLSTLPLISTKILSLPDAKYEPRSSIIHEVQAAEDCVIAFANVHFEWITGAEGSANRLKQAHALVEYLDSMNHATVITGDFNCTPDSPTMQFFKAQGFEFVDKGDDNLTFQVGNKKEIDHLIYRNSDFISIIPQHIDVLDEPMVSDHRPLVVELKISF